jgi:ketol-acid reductoisomerase
MATFYYDDDVDRQLVLDATVATIGYGNQGRAQSLNLRDSGARVVVGNREDEHASLARADGFEVMSVRDAAAVADIVLLLLPDEIQREVFAEEIGPVMSEGTGLCFAHGYNIRFGLIVPPADIDVFLVAPRMIGAGVRELYDAHSGAPAFVAVYQDASGKALAKALSVAWGIGATRPGVLLTTFAEETELDLFSEQAFWPLVVSFLTEALAILTGLGYQSEAVLMELYASGEPSRVFAKMAEMGLFGQLPLHSRTSQYGTLSRSSRMDKSTLREWIKRAIGEIRQGEFAREWEAAQKIPDEGLEHLLQAAAESDITQKEARLKARLHTSTS